MFAACGTFLHWLVAGAGSECRLVCWDFAEKDVWSRVLFAGLGVLWSVPSFRQHEEMGAGLSILRVRSISDRAETGGGGAKTLESPRVWSDAARG